MLTGNNLEAKIKDCVRLCEKYSSARFTSFLTEEEQATIGIPPAARTQLMYFGGYDGAARRIFGAFPEWEDSPKEQFPIDIIRVNKKYPKELTHRDYLGTVLSMGIERDTVGDILVDSDGAYIFVQKEVTDYLLSGIEKISNCGVRLNVVDVNDVIIPKQEFEDISSVIASMRLDAVVGAVTRLSRSKALVLINSDKVSLNHIVQKESSKGVSENDIISIRGFGKYLVSEVGGRTGSGKLHVHIKKYR